MSGSWADFRCDAVLLGAGAHPTDVRMTTRFKEHDLTEVLHLLSVNPVTAFFIVVHRKEHCEVTYYLSCEY